MNIILPEMKVTSIPFLFHEDWIPDSEIWKKSAIIVDNGKVALLGNAKLF